MFKSLLFTFLFLPLRISYAATPLLEEVDIVPIAKELALSSDLATFWGGIQRFWGMGFSDGRETMISSSFFEDGALPIYLSVSEKDTASLIVFFPGLFSSHRGNIVPKTLSQLEKDDSHLVSIPNFFSKVYLAARPIYPKGIDREDFIITIDILKRAIAKIRRIKKIKSMIFIGESLGGFVATVIASMLEDELSLPPVKKLILLWPSLNLKYSVDQFDWKILNSREDVSKCSFLFDLPSIFYHTLKNDFPPTSNRHTYQCINVMLYQKIVLSGVKNLVKFSDLNLSPIELDQLILSEAIKVSRTSLFQRYFEKNSKETLIKRWMEKINLNDKEIYMLSSKDDFINDLADWESLKKQFADFPNIQIKLLSWGGHTGPMGTSQIESLLQSLVRIEN